MSDGTTIEWADASWPVTVGCSRISPGCGTAEGGCYAEKMAWRLSHNPATTQYQGTVRMTDHGPRWTGVVKVNEEVLMEPLHWRKHRRIFIASMSDLFHDGVPDEHLDRVFATVLACEFLDNRQPHTFMALTKRAARMRAYFSAPPVELLQRWAKAADGRIILDNADVFFSDDLRATPAHHRFVSHEPLLEDLGNVNLQGIHLAIIGGESGSKSRPCDIDWMRSLVKQCRAQGTAPFVKQTGANRILGGARFDPSLAQIRAKKGNVLEELPEDLRVREWCTR